MDSGVGAVRLGTGIGVMRRFGPVLLVIAGVLLMAGGAGYWWFERQIAVPEAAILPPDLAGLPLVEASYGPEAVANVTRLHDQSFPLTSGAHGRYGRSGDKAMLWVTGTPARLVATRMVGEMEAAIAEGSSPFQPVGTRQVNGHTIYELIGMGQRHYYFRSGTAVVWLAADDALADAALVETLTFYP